MVSSKKRGSTGRPAAKASKERAPSQGGARTSGTASYHERTSSHARKGHYAASQRARKLDQLLALANILGIRRGAGLGWRRQDIQEKLREASYPHSKNTILRNLQALREFGFPVRREMVNGEARYSIPYESLKNWSTMPVGLQREALALALMALGQLGRTELYEHLARFAERWRIVEAAAQESSWRARLPEPNVPKVMVVQWVELHTTDQVVADVERALRERRRLRIRYQGVRDEAPQWRTVDPAGLQVGQRALYLHAWCLAREAPRIFKLSRILESILLDEPAEHAERVRFPAQVAKAVVAWSDEPVDVAVLLSNTVARFAEEYPLHKHQRIERLADGSAIVHATVAGLVEAARWAIGWGKEARVLSPPPLVEAVREELRAALEAYSEEPSLPVSR